MTTERAPKVLPPFELELYPVGATRLSEWTTGGDFPTLAAAEAALWAQGEQLHLYQRARVRQYGVGRSTAVSLLSWDLSGRAPARAPEIPVQPDWLEGGDDAAA